MLNEADTCTRYIVPRLREAGWDTEPHSFNEQQLVQFTDGRIVMAGNRVRRRPPKRADYLLKFTRDFTIAVVEAKSEDCGAGDGLQQAKDYAETLGLKFAYATNGHEVIESDYLTGTERELSQFPSPSELWDRYRNHTALAGNAAAPVLEPFKRINRKTGRALFYFEGEDPRHAAHYSRIIDPAVRQPHNRYTQAFNDDETLDVWIRQTHPEPGRLNFQWEIEAKDPTAGTLFDVPPPKGDGT